MTTSGALRPAGYSDVEEPRSTILVADDSEPVREVTTGILRAAGFAVLEAANGADALRLGGELPALVILDVHLPDVDGLEVCRRLKADPLTASIPVLHLSATYRDVTDRVRGLETGADAYLTKPVGAAELVATVRALLRARRAEAHLEMSEARREAAEALARENARLLAEVRDSEERFREGFEHSGIGMALQHLDGRYFRVNRALCELLGYTEAELLARTFRDVTHPDDVAIDAAHDQEMLAGERRWYQCEKRYLGTRGQVIWGLVGVSLLRDPGGRPLYFLAQVQDVTGRKQAEEARATLEGQLRQAQKMEAIGQLAGGVAHDFNNLLTVILGRSHVLLHRLDPGDPLRRQVDLIQKTAERAAELTRQLLAFGRKQVLQPKVLDLNAVVRGMERMVRRLIGEHIELVTALDSDVGSVLADPGQIEQVILNLAVNARDAMAQGGRLGLETANVLLDEAFARGNPGARRGRYVRLGITDTGVGMDAETRAHVFEPFFTTKEVGKGTGLGLATVYGIVKQSGGYITVASELGRGARFDIYLPRVAGAAAGQGSGPVLAELLRGSETILLVEDQDEVRELARDVLRMSGYGVLEARDGGEALERAVAHAGPIHVLVTDMVMPRMGGRELADRLTATHPLLRVLYVSGYTDDVLVQHGALDPGTAFLQKPFRPETLARAVRELLDTPSRHQ